MMNKKFRVNDLVKYDYSEIGEYIDENHTDRPLRNDEVCDLLNEQQATIDQLNLAIDDLLSYTSCDKIKEENEQLKEQVQILNKCCRFKSSDEAIKQAYADLNRREREKHSQGNTTYTAKINQNEVIY